LKKTESYESSLATAVIENPALFGLGKQDANNSIQYSFRREVVVGS
jgi:hypothetical protein